MKKLSILTTTIITLFITSSIFISCSNDDQIDNLENNNELKVMNSDELNYLNKLTEDLNNFQKSETRKGSIKNPNNHVDDYGLYITKMVNELSVEITSSNVRYTQEEIKDMTDMYMINNPMSIILPKYDTLNKEFYYSLAKLIKNTYLIEDADFSIQKIILIENDIYKTKLLSSTEKTYLLAFCSSMKYTKQYVNAASLENLRNCVDDTMVEVTGENLSVLTNYEEHPGLTIGAWVGLPATIGWSIFDAILVTIKDCA